MSDVFRISIHCNPISETECMHEIVLSRPDFGVAIGHLSETDLKDIETAISSYLNGNTSE